MIDRWKPGGGCADHQLATPVISLPAEVAGTPPALTTIMPNENNNQQSKNQPQKQAQRDREQQRNDRIPQRGPEQPDEDRGIGRKHDEPSEPE